MNRMIKTKRSNICKNPNHGDAEHSDIYDGISHALYLPCYQGLQAAKSRELTQSELIFKYEDADGRLPNGCQIGSGVYNDNTRPGQLTLQEQTNVSSRRLTLPLNSQTEYEAAIARLELLTETATTRVGMKTAESIWYCGPISCQCYSCEFMMGFFLYVPESNLLAVAAYAGGHELQQSRSRIFRQQRSPPSVMQRVLKRREKQRTLVEQ